MVDLEDYRSDVENQWCPGCPNFSILIALKKALLVLDKKPEEFVSHSLDRGVFVRDFSKKHGLEPDRYFRITVGQRQNMERLAQVLQSIC